MITNMIQRLNFDAKQKTGFTMLELLIAIAILAIISTVAVTSYQQHIVSSRRADAQVGLMNLIAQAEQYYLQNNNTYPSSASSLTLPTSSYYTFSGDQSCGTNCFRAVATATGGQLKADAACTPLTLDTTGARSPTTASCWNR